MRPIHPYVINRCSLLVKFTSKAGPVRSLGLAAAGDVILVGGENGLLDLQPMPNLTLASAAVTEGMVGTVESMVASTVHTASHAIRGAQSSAVDKLGTAKGERVIRVESVGHSMGACLAAECVVSCCQYR